MIAFNLSVDFELGWGDLDRLTHDDVFYRRVVCGLEQSLSVVDVLNRNVIPSTWGVVGGCCCRSLEELRERSPRGFALIEQQIEILTVRRAAYAEVLFCRQMVEAILESNLIDVGSHGFMHLLPAGVQTEILQNDVSASVKMLREVSGRDVESFIPPQNYHWPDDAFDHSGIKYIRHTPNVFGRRYSDPGAPAKFARLWNDLVRPVNHVDPAGQSAQLFFLRVDRGAHLWKAQLRMIRRLLASGSGSAFCYIHPHNLDTPELVSRFADLCNLVGESRDRGKLFFRKFCRELHSQSVLRAEIFDRV